MNFSKLRKKNVSSRLRSHKGQLITKKSYKKVSGTQIWQHNKHPKIHYKFLDPSLKFPSYKTWKNNSQTVKIFPLKFSSKQAQKWGKWKHWFRFTHYIFIFLYLKEVNGNSKNKKIVGMHDVDGCTWEWNERKLGRNWGNKRTSSSAAAFRGTDSFFIVSYFIQGTVKWERKCWL